MLAIAAFFLMKGIGLLFAGFAVYRAIQLQMGGSKYGVAAIIISSAALVIVGIGWLMRMSGAGV